MLRGDQMLDDKKLIQLIRYIELELDEDYLISSSLIQKIKKYGYELFSDDKVLTKKEKEIFKKANKAIKDTK